MTILPLGKKADYKIDYDPSLLYIIPRENKRREININPNILPFTGYDIWHCYEVTWLDANGKPEIAIAKLAIPCNSPYIVESKSLKLYLVSFVKTKFHSKESVQKTIKKDLETKLCSTIKIQLLTLKNLSQKRDDFFDKSKSLDNLKITCNEYMPNKNLLVAEEKMTKETLYSQLFKSNCPVTNQPDYATIFIQYHGIKINHTGLLKYIISYRDKTEFHEQCIERIFMDIKGKCNPKELTICAKFNRRGGIDINPLRTDDKNFHIDKIRLL